MPSGGARRNSGPPADPTALRRDRKDDAAWEVLPSGKYDGPVPEFPLGVGASGLWDRELALWDRLWEKPQAHMWARLGLEFEVAAYVRAFIESTSAESNAGLKTAALRMAAEIGLSLPGMHSLRWKFADDELATRRNADAPAVRSKSARDRLRALNA